MVDEIELLEKINCEMWKEVHAVKHPQSGYYFDSLIIRTHVRAVTFSGISNIFSDAVEIFSIGISLYDPNEPSIPADWFKPRGHWDLIDLRHEWAGRNVTSIFDPPRIMTFWTHPEFREVVYPAKSRLNECVAIQFNEPDKSSEGLVIMAAQAYPCHVLVFVGEEYEKDSNEWGMFQECERLHIQFE